MSTKSEPVDKKKKEDEEKEEEKAKRGILPTDMPNPADLKKDEKKEEKKEGEKESIVVSTEGEVSERSIVSNVKAVIDMTMYSQADLNKLSGVAPSFSLVSLELVKKKGMVCKWTMDLVNIRKAPIFRFGFKISDFSDPVTFETARFNLIEQINETYEGMIYDTPLVSMSEYNDYNERAADSVIGFDVYNEIKRVTDQDRTQFIQSLRTAHALDVTDQSVSNRDLYKDVTFFTSPAEFELQSFYHNIEKMKILPNGFQRMHDFLSYLIDDDRYRLATLAAYDPLIRLEYTYLLHIGATSISSFSTFLSEDSNYFMNEFINDIAHFLIKKSVTIGFKDESKEFGALLREQRISTTQFSTDTELVIQLNQQKAFSSLLIILQCLLVPQFSQIEYHTGVSFKLSTLLDCILIHCIIPKELIDEVSRNRIRNYLLRWLIFTYQMGRQGRNAASPILNASNNMGITPDAYRHAQMDYLDLFFRQYNGLIRGDAYLLAFYNLFQNWGRVGNVVIGLAGIPYANDFMNGNRVYFTPLSGRILQKGDEPTQLIRFNTFFQTFCDRNIQFNSPERVDFKPALRVLLGNMSVDFSNNWAHLIWFIDEVQRRLSPCSVFRPYDGTEYQTIREKKRLMLDKLGLYSMIRLTSAVDIDYVPFDREILFYGWSNHYWFNKFAHLFWLRTDWFQQWKDRTEYNKDSMVTWALSKVGMSTGIENYLTKARQGSVNFTAMKIPRPSWQYFDLKFKEAEKFSNRSDLHGMFGYVKNALLVPFSIITDEPELYRELYDVPSGFASARIIDRDQMIRFLTEKDENGKTKFNYVVNTAANRSQVIVFDFPFKIEEKELTISGPDLTTPFILTTPLRQFDYGRIYFQYTYWDKYFNIEAPERSLLYTPKFLPPIRPVKDRLGLHFPFVTFQHDFRIYRSRFERYEKFAIVVVQK